MMKLGLLFLTLLGSTDAFVSPTTTATRRNSVVSKSPSTRLHLALLDPSHVNVLETASTLLSDAVSAAVPEEGGIGYSKWSYYTILGLYTMSFPGLWSTIKRSTKAKIKRKEFVTAGENAPEGMALRQQAGEIMACKYTLYSYVYTIGYDSWHCMLVVDSLFAVCKIQLKLAEKALYSADAVYDYAT
jgi:hypothetical protein